MSATRVEVPSCEVPGRKYVLKCRRRTKVVVQSPMCQIPSTIENVPIKRFNNNYVCFVPRKGIEEDSSNAYEKEKVRKITSSVEAHGVALFDSEPEEEFNYQQEDRFWIWIDADTNMYQTAVRVINLRTFESGDISLDRVCWYPKMQGPNHELWTLGGGVLITKFNGAKQSSSRSWVICQKLDQATTAKNVEIPDFGVPVRDVIELSHKDQRSLFVERYQHMKEAIRTAGDKANIFARDSSMLTPPSSTRSESAGAMELDGVIMGQTTPQLSRRTSVNNTQCRTGVFELASNGSWTLLKGNSIQAENRSFPPSETRHLPTECDYQSSHYDAAEESIFEGIEHPMSKSTLSPTSSTSSLRASNELISPELVQPDGPDLLTLLMGVTRAGEEVEPTSRFLFSITDPRVLNGSVSINQLHQTEKASERYISFDRAFVKSLCDLSHEDCKYSNRFPWKHYHSPPSKCRFETRQIFWGDTHHKNSNQEGPPHEHCISGAAGGCILSTMPSLNHFCCYWDEEDLIELPSPPKRAFDTGRDGMKLLDRSDQVQETWRGIPMEMGMGTWFNDQGCELFAEDEIWKEIPMEMGTCFNDQGCELFAEDMMSDILS